MQTTTMFSSEASDWCTPEEIIYLVNQINGGIGLDPCSNAGSLVKAKTEWCGPPSGPCGLTSEWGGHGLVYVNPPYGRVVSAWTTKASAEGKLGTEIAMLLPARVDTKWWQVDVVTAQAVCFWRGRLTFLGAPSGAPFPSAVAYWGPNVDRFIELFGQFGWTVRTK